jgi:hypothetical protein
MSKRSREYLKQWREKREKVVRIGPTGVESTPPNSASKAFYRHVDTGDIYAIERCWDGGIVGSAGPLQENDLKDLDNYEYTADRNGWLMDASDKLILGE